jgi:hypothetical protein
VSAIALIAAARILVSALEQRPFSIFEARGDGSLRSQGRPAESLCEAMTESTHGSVQSYAIALRSWGWGAAWLLSLRLNTCRFPGFALLRLIGATALLDGNASEAARQAAQASVLAPMVIVD